MFLLSFWFTSGRFPLTPPTVCFVGSDTVVTLTGADRLKDRQTDS